MNVGVVTFPGSNCDADARWAAGLDGSTVHKLWHKDTSLPTGLDLVILPGGFSYGDYLRTGAIARFSPIMNEVISFANRGGLVMGICNGFQILCEAGLLPGALIRNSDLSFICKDVYLRVENDSTPFTISTGSSSQQPTVLRIPIAHGEGRYTTSDADLRRLEDTGRVVFRYCDPDGTVSETSNPNGSMKNIAGIVNDSGNVLGMMPHPERAANDLIGSADGLTIFRSLAAFVERTTAATV
ncbi:MAG TPA: phosphoribosylformylglycinamidine synthase subunit PurQ [Chlorobiota bacterium]|nr:phosphoribosylformylglycinamidine synthase subunit PurQ [Chlorobiota bacterium]